MTDLKYTRPVSMYVEPLYTTYDEDYTPEEYVTLLTDHLKYVRTVLESFKQEYENVEEIRVRVSIDRDYDSISNECYLIGRIPLSREERKKIDEDERVKKEILERVEKQKLEELLKKYPGYDKKI